MAKLKRVASNVADGQSVHKFVAAEGRWRLGGEVVVVFVTAAPRVVVPEMLVVLLGVALGVTEVEIMGIGTTSSDEFCAFRYELPPPIT